MNKRRVKSYLEDMPLDTIKASSIENISRTLSKQIDKEIFQKKYTSIGNVLKLVGTGAFLISSIAIPNLPIILKPFLINDNEYETWKRFNIPYLKRALLRLEKQKLVTIRESHNQQVVEITDRGRRRILKYALDELAVEKPKFWDNKWRLVSYDIPRKASSLRKIFREYLRAWGFYQLHESVFLHAYPCIKQVEFLREYLGIGKYVRVFFVDKIENDRLYKDFYGI